MEGVRPFCGITTNAALKPSKSDGGLQSFDEGSKVRWDSRAHDSHAKLAACVLRFTWVSGLKPRARIAREVNGAGFGFCGQNVITRHHQPGFAAARDRLP